MTSDPFRDPDPVNGPIDAQFEPAPAGADKAARPGPGWIALGAAAVLAALIGAVAGIYGADFVRPNSTPELAAAQKRLESRLGEVMALQAAIDQKLSEPAAASAELAGLIRELDVVSRRLDQAIAAGGDPAALAALTSRLDALEGRAAADAEVAALTARLAGLEAATREAAAESSAAVKSSGSRADAALALSAIEAAMRRGTGFESDYRALRNALPMNNEIKRLAPYVSGVPALTALQAEFPSVRAAVLAAEVPDTSGRLSWVDRVFGDAVSVRPANGKHTAVTRGLDAAAAALAAGDLAGSVQALGVLEGDAARAAEDWTRRANRRITLEAALEDVRLSLAEGGN
ncbi:MAG: hypothetical protein Q8L84_00435 [Hyphomonas sp.]|nr:hypothetical protein [Hyphomonas sp.]